MRYIWPTGAAAKTLHIEKAYSHSIRNRQKTSDSQRRAHDWIDRIRVANGSARFRNKKLLFVYCFLFNIDQPPVIFFCHYRKIYVRGRKKNSLVRFYALAQFSLTPSLLPLKWIFFISPKPCFQVYRPVFEQQEQQKKK